MKVSDPYCAYDDAQHGATAMTGTRSAIEEFVRDLRIITARTEDPRIIVAHLGPLVRNLALSKAWLEAKHYECDLNHGFGAHLLHEEPDRISRDKIEVGKERVNRVRRSAYDRDLRSASAGRCGTPGPVSRS